MNKNRPPPIRPPIRPGSSTLPYTMGVKFDPAIMPSPHMSQGALIQFVMSQDAVDRLATFWRQQKKHKHHKKQMVVVVQAALTRGVAGLPVPEGKGAPKLWPAEVTMTPYVNTSLLELRNSKYPWLATVMGTPNLQRPEHITASLRTASPLLPPLPFKVRLALYTVQFWLGVGALIPNTNKVEPSSVIDSPRFVIYAVRPSR